MQRRWHGLHMQRARAAGQRGAGRRGSARGRGRRRVGGGERLGIGFGRGGPAGAHFDVRSFAECHGPALSKGFFYFLFIFFAECPVSGTHKDPLCRVLGLALGKEFFFCSQIFSLGFIQCFKVHVKIWLNFVTFYYNFRIIFVLLIYFAKNKFELKFLSTVRDNVHETFPNFYHRLHMLYNDASTSFVIF